MKQQWCKETLGKKNGQSLKYITCHVEKNKHNPQSCYEEKQTVFTESNIITRKSLRTKAEGEILT